MAVSHTAELYLLPSTVCKGMYVCGHRHGPCICCMLLLYPSSLFQTTTLLRSLLMKLTTAALTSWCSCPTDAANLNVEQHFQTSAIVPVKPARCKVDHWQPTEGGAPPLPLLLLLLPPLLLVVLQLLLLPAQHKHHSPHFVWSSFATNGAAHILQLSLVCPSVSTYAVLAMQGLHAIFMYMGS